MSIYKLQYVKFANTVKINGRETYHFIHSDKFRGVEGIIDEELQIIKLKTKRGILGLPWHANVEYFEYGEKIEEKTNAGRKRVSSKEKLRAAIIA